MKKTVFKRIITFMLIIVMIAGMFPANVTAHPSVSEQLGEDEQPNVIEQPDKDEQSSVSEQLDEDEQSGANEQLDEDKQPNVIEQPDKDEQSSMSEQLDEDEQSGANEQLDEDEQSGASEQLEENEQPNVSEQLDKDEQSSASEQLGEHLDVSDQLSENKKLDEYGHSGVVHTVTNNFKTYELPILPIESNYVLVQNFDSKDVILLAGGDTDYFGSDMKTIWNYNSSCLETDFAASYISSFDGEKYAEWLSNDVGDSFSLLNYKILYKSKLMYPVSPSRLTRHIFTTLPEGVSWNDKIIISSSNGVFRLYKPANNYGMWIDVNNINCNFHYRDTLTSASQTIAEYIYNTNSHTWTKGTYGRTQGYDYETFYIGSDVYSTDGTIRRSAQHYFYIQSSESEDDEDVLVSDLSTLLTNDSYIILRNTSSNFLIVLIGEDDGYFGSDTRTIWNYDSSYSVTNFSASYVSPYDGEKYIGFAKNDVDNSFSLSGYEILYKSKLMYPISPDWETGHIFATLPEGVTWDDKIIISYSNGSYRLYKPENNNGMWVDAENINCNFYYRNALTSSNKTVSQYTYNTTSRKWTKGTYGRTQGGAYEIFYVGSDVFLTDGTIRRAGQHDFYAQTPVTTVPIFKPLESSEAKEFLSFIANCSESEVEQKLPEYYGFLTGTIPDTLELRVSFISYLYYCLDIQLAQIDKTIDMSTTYLINWVEDNTSTATIVYDKIMDEVIGNLEETFLQSGGAPQFISATNLASDLIDYSILLVTVVGSALKLKRADEINYLRAYIKLLEAKHGGDEYEIELWEMECSRVVLSGNGFNGNPEKMRKYAEYIFSIEHGISSNSSAN